MHSWLNNPQNVAFLFWSHSHVRKNARLAFHACIISMPAFRSIPECGNWKWGYPDKCFAAWLQGQWQTINGSEATFDIFSNKMHKFTVISKSYCNILSDFPCWLTELSSCECRVVIAAAQAYTVHLQSHSHALPSFLLMAIQWMWQLLRACQLVVQSRPGVCQR